MFDRRVSRIITPGTLIDERFMDTAVNNFLLAIHAEDSSDLSQKEIEAADKVGPELSPVVGLAWIDLSTGDFFTQSTELPSLLSAIARIGPREIILGQDTQAAGYANLVALLEHERLAVSRSDGLTIQSTIEAWNQYLENAVSSTDAALFSAEEVAAGTSLLNYIEIQLQGLKTKLQAPIRRQPIEAMSIDKNSMRALEIKTTLREGASKGSLLHAMRRTVTNSGSRLLSDWISRTTILLPGLFVVDSDNDLAAPSTSTPIINGRLDLTTVFLNDPVLRETIVSLLGRTFDAQRLVQKFSLGRGDPDDLVSLYKTIQATEAVAVILAEDLARQRQTEAHAADEEASSGVPLSQCISTLYSRFNLDEPRALANRITQSIDEDGLSRTHERDEVEAAGAMSLAQEVAAREDTQQGLSSLPKRVTRVKSVASLDNVKSRYWEEEDVWVMKKNASEALIRLHDKLEELRTQKSELEADLQERYGATTLSLRWTPGLGHICHVKGKDTKSELANHENAKSVSASKSTRSLHLPEWTDLGAKIDHVRLQIKSEEQQVFRKLRDEVKGFSRGVTAEADW